MERFFVLDPTEDPCPWETRKVIYEFGFQNISGEDLRIRLHEAVVAAIGSIRGAEGNSVVAVIGPM
jgi:hypothetical protein